MSRILTRVACGAFLVLAGVQEVRAAPVELVRAGDSEMSCEALAAEINTLSAAKAKAAKRAESGRKLLGFASTAVQIASGAGVLGGLGGRGGGGGYMAQQALGSIQAQATQQQMAQAYGAQGLAGVPAAAPGLAADESVEGQRLDRLADLRAKKGC